MLALSWSGDDDGVPRPCRRFSVPYYDGGVPETIVLLHGFAGTRRAWDGVIDRLPPERCLPLTLDLPGHGEYADAPRPITFAGCVAHVLAHSPERFALCGYSLGGRVALHVALAAPERVSRLVLVSTTAGIEDESERAQRSAADHRLADELEGGSQEDFVARWCAQPMFAEDPPAVDALAREDYRRNRPDAIAAVLRGIGTGEMIPLWDRLHKLKLPATVLVGERDMKFLVLGRGLADLLPQAVMTIAPGGHRLPLENPAAVAKAID
jgi:2-succinyl-6-hydroxy-2,4-cyclohexadiene-1-carboxylate synthase